MRAYAGIGSRIITDVERDKIGMISHYLADAGFTLYSGNAEGADKAFQGPSCGRYIAFLPWNNFGGAGQGSHLMCGGSDAETSVDEHHPNPGALSPMARKLMARNYFQVMGFKQYPRVEFVICCAPSVNGGPHVLGGTGQAVRIALANGIPVFNIRRPGDMDRIKELLTNIENARGL